MSTLDTIKKVVREVRLQESDGYELKLTVIKNSPQYKKITKWLDDNEVVWDISASRGKEVDISVLLNDEKMAKEIQSKFKSDVVASVIVKL